MLILNFAEAPPERQRNWNGGGIGHYRTGARCVKSEKDVGVSSTSASCLVCSIRCVPHSNDHQSCDHMDPH